MACKNFPNPQGRYYNNYGTLTNWKTVRKHAKSSSHAISIKIWNEKNKKTNITQPITTSLETTNDTHSNDVKSKNNSPLAQYKDEIIIYDDNTEF